MTTYVIEYFDGESMNEEHIYDNIERARKRAKEVKTNLGKETLVRLFKLIKSY